MAGQNNNVNLRQAMGMGRGGPPHERLGLAAEKANDTKGTLKRLLKYIGQSKYLLFSLVGVIIVITVLSLLAPVLQAKAIDSFTLTDGKLHVDFESLVTILITLAAVYALSAFMTLVQGICAAKLSQNTVKILRNDLFRKISRLPLKFIDSHKHGDIMSRMTNDVDNISNTISQSIASLFSAVITVLGCFFIMLYFSPLLTLVSMLTVALTLFSTKFLSKYMRKYFPMQQRHLGTLNGHIEEMVTGYHTVVAFGREDKAKEEFDRISDDFCKTAIKAQVFGGCMGPCMNVISNISFLLIAAFGGWLTFSGFNPLSLAGAMTIGVIQAFIIYSKQFTRPINEIAQQYAAIQTAIAGAERVFEIMDQPDEIDEGTVSLDFSKIKGDICFTDVDFSYVEGQPVLKGFDFWVKDGQKIAIVGATGSGKTTVVNLLTRFYEVDSGTITLDNRDITEIKKYDLRKSIGIVLQDTTIFSDTIAQNIRYGKPDATDEEIIAAAKTAKLDEFVNTLADGYNTMLTESGSNLSQGQRQLIAIARVVICNPQILILDEATSSIDTRTEVQIQEAMNELMKGRTSLIIAHRLSTIKDADKIVVIEKGDIVEAGNHEELLALKGCYYKLYQTQFAGRKT